MKNFLGPWVLLAGTSAAVWSAWGWGGSNAAKEADDGSGHGAAEIAVDEAAAAAAGYDLLVDFDDGIGPDVLAATPFAEEAVSHYTAEDKLYRIRFDNFAEASAAFRTLRQNPALEALDWEVPASLPPDELRALSPYPTATCEPVDVSKETAGFPNDPCYRYQWNLQQIGLPAAWKLGQGKGIVVAVIDTGVTAVPDLEGIEIMKGHNFISGNADARDDHGHGTHVAGTIAQATNNRLGVAGVAFGARIMPIKALSGDGIGTLGAVVHSIKYAADNGAHVINMSLGGPFPIWTIHNAIKYAKKKGVLVVAAAGNESRRVGYPAKYIEVLSVGATRFDEGTTFYSNFGKGLDVAAPGGDLRVDQNGDGMPDGILQNTITPGNIKRVEYMMFMGTSMASPHAAGVAALIMGAGVTNPDAVMNLMRATARRPKTIGSKSTGDAAGAEVLAAGDTPVRLDDKYGAGIIDANAALTRVKTVHGAGGLGLAGALAFVGLFGLGRRNQLGRLGPGFLVGLTAGAAGLFVLPLLMTVPAPLTFLTVGVPEMIPATFAGFGQGNPLLYGAFLPFGAIALLAGVPRLRGLLGGLCFGIAGALAVVALTGALDVTFVPDLLDRPWLLANTAAAALLGRFVMRR